MLMLLFNTYPHFSALILKTIEFTFVDSLKNYQFCNIQFHKQNIIKIPQYNQLILTNKYSMLHPTDLNQHSSLNKTIRLSSTTRAQPVGRTLKSTIINYKDSISHRNNDPMQNRSMQLEKKQSVQDNARQKWDKVNVQQRDASYNWNRQMQNQRQSLLGASRQIKRISTELDDSMHRSNQKSIQLSQNRTPVLKKDESQFTQLTRTSHNIHNDNFSNQERAHYQNQIQQYVNKIQMLQNQIRNLRSQNDHLHRSLSIPKQILQREIENKNFKIDDLQKKLTNKNREYLDKCLDHQKNIARITELDQFVKKIQNQKQRLIKQLDKSNQNSTSLSKLLNQSRLMVSKLEIQKKKINGDFEAEKIKTTNLAQQKKQLQLQLQKIKKIKQLVRELQQSDNDKQQTIKRHIAYQAQLIQLNGVMISNLETHKHDLKVTSDQHQGINKQIEAITNQIAIKMKDVLDQKQKVEDQLVEARAQTERIRKTMFVGYQQIISKLKDQIIQLKQENVNLSNNSQSKITIVKLERQIKILQTKIQDLNNRNKEMQQIIQRLKIQNKKTISQISTETSIRGPQYFDRTGTTGLQSIIMTYETRSLDLNERIHEKEINQQQLKRRIEQLQIQIQQFKDQAQLSNRKEKSDNENVKAKIQSMKMQLKAQTQSLNRKIQTLEGNIQRKNRQIKQKDNFITHYLIQKVKGQMQVNQIIQQIEKFFIQVK